LACLVGKTREELKEMEVTFTKSQLMLLYAMRFIDYIKDSNTEKIITTMPILGSKEKRSLIKKVRKSTYEIEPELEEDIYALKKTLKKIGHEDHTFSILFSAVIDGIVWLPFRAQGFVTEFALTPQKPLYDGVYWAYYPKRDFRCGTNIALGDDVYVLLNWSDGPMEKIQKVFNWKNLRLIHDDYLKYGKIVNEELRHKLKLYKVIDAAGNLTVPIIEMKSNDPIFLTLQSMASKIVKLIGEKLDLESLKEEYGFWDKEKAFVVAYHEWMWEFMEYLNEQGIVKKPLAFSNPKEAEPKDIGDLLFLVKGSIN